MLIINADDFGRNERANRGIIRAFRAGLCSSATIMTNMPAFDHAVELYRQHALNRCVGLHLVLTEGSPLTESMKRTPRFCNADGFFHLTRRERVVWLSSAEETALRQEIRAQIQRCRDFGISPTHVDSHSHAHEEWAILSVLLDVVRAEQIPAIRLMRNCPHGTSALKQWYRRVCNRRIRRAELAGTDWFGHPSEYPMMCPPKQHPDDPVSIELMIHPVENEDGTLWDYFLRRPLCDILRAVTDIDSAVSYAGVKWLGTAPLIGAC